MDLTQQKLQIIEWTTRQERAGNIQKVLTLIQQLDNETIDEKRVMGYRKGGNAVTGKELVNSMNSGLQDVARGELIPLDRIENESEQW